jgi:hypothetical protein
MEKSAYERLQNILQSTLLWGSVCMFATIVLTVVAVMVHDFRWILGLAWPFAAAAIWEFSRLYFSRRTIIIAVTSVFSMASAALLGWLYLALAPSEVLPPPPPPPPPSKETKPGSVVSSTFGWTEYKCKWDGVMPDQKAQDRNTAAFRRYISILAETMGGNVAFPKILGGDKAEITPKPGDNRWGNYSKLSFEIRRLGKDLLGIFAAEFVNDPFKVISNQVMQPDSDFESRIRKRIEDVAGVRKGECELQ